MSDIHVSDIVPYLLDALLYFFLVLHPVEAWWKELMSGCAPPPLGASLESGLPGSLTVMLAYTWPLRIW